MTQRQLKRGGYDKILRGLPPTFIETIPPNPSYQTILAGEFEKKSIFNILSHSI